MSVSKQPLVLVVDDEQIIVDLVTDILRRNGYRCHGCLKAEEALQAATDLTVDLIISDINLDGVSGLEMCERIKRQQGCQETPVMFLSGAQIPDIIRRSHAAGGSYYLRKPFDPDVLIELVDKALWMPHLIRHHVEMPTPTPVAADSALIS